MESTKMVFNLFKIGNKELEFFEELLYYVKNEMKQTVIEIFLKYLETRGFSITPTQFNNQDVIKTNESQDIEPLIKNKENENQFFLPNLEGLGKRNKDILKCPHKNRKHYAKVN